MDKTAIVLTEYVIVSIPDYSCCLRTFRTTLVLSLLVPEKKTLKRFLLNMCMAAILVS